MSELIRAARAAPEGWRLREWAGLVTAGGLFGDLERTSFRHVLELPLELLDDHLRSYSGIAALPDSDRAALAAQVRQLVGDGSDVLAIPFVVDAYRCRRT